MGLVSINRITNANVYIGGASQLGKVSEVSLPQVTTLQSDHNALGLFGKLKFSTGIDALEAEFKFTSWYGDILKATNDPFGVQDVQVRTSIDQYTPEGRTGQVPGVAYIRGQFINPKLGVFKQHDNVETDVKMNVFAVRIEIDGKPILEIDVMANIYKVNGEDKLGTYRQNLGA